MKIIKQREIKEEIYYTYDFDREDGSGFTFPCNSIGEVQLNEYNKESYNYCIQHKDKFKWEGVIKHKSNYIEPAIGRCFCGEEFELINQYMEACQCPKCGQWYNIFGQALIDPKYWEKDY